MHSHPLPHSLHTPFLSHLARSPSHLAPSCIFPRSDRQIGGFLLEEEPFDPVFDNDDLEPLGVQCRRKARPSQLWAQTPIPAPASPPLAPELAPVAAHPGVKLRKAPARRPNWLFALVVVSCGPLMACGLGDEEGPIAKGAVLVQLKSHAVLPSAGALAAALGAIEVVAHLEAEGEPPLLRIPLPPGADERAAARALGEDDAVAFAEPVRLYARARQPNDPRFSSQWGLAKIGAPAVWNRTIGDKKTVVAIIDDGVALDHADLSPNLWTNPDEQANGEDEDQDGFIDDVHGADFVDEDGDPSPEAGDAEWHGSHVAGIVGAAGGNGRGVSGVNWKVSLMALRGLGPQGGRSDDLARAIDYATAHGARVLNASWGGGGKSQALEQALTRAARKGVLFVAAAGNDGRSSPGYPASLGLDNVVSVSASDPNDQLASFSNAGGLLAAPGVGILSTTSPGHYESWDGTSMATPFVSGLAALLWSAHPEATLAQVRRALLASATHLPGVLWGRIDAPAALASLDQLIGAPQQPVALTASRPELFFTAAPDGSARAEVLSVRSEAGDAARFHAQADATWLRLPRTSATTPARFTIDVDARGLALGSYHGQVELIPDGGGGPFVVTVQLRVVETSQMTAVGALCSLGNGVLHTSAGGLCALDASALPGARALRWTHEGKLLARGARFTAFFPTAGRSRLDLGPAGFVDVETGPRR